MGLHVEFLGGLVSLAGQWAGDLPKSTVQRRIVELRSNVDLMQRSDSAEIRADAGEAALQAQAVVDSRDLTDMPPSMAALGLEWGMDAPMRKHLCQCEAKPRYRHPVVEEQDRYFANRGRDARQAAWANRAGCELAERVAEGHYTFFGTLTVDPKRHSSRDVVQHGQAWSEFKEHTEFECGRAAGVVERDGKGRMRFKDGFRASDVCKFVRAGDVGDHDNYHIHFVMVASHVPDSWLHDPLATGRFMIDSDGNRVPRLAVCKPAALPWKRWGYAEVQYAWCYGCAWQRLDWTMPADVMQDGLPLPFELGAYVTKYAGKSIDRLGFPARVSATRGFGVEACSRLLAECTVAELLSVQSMPSRGASVQWQCSTDLPFGMFRAAAADELLRRSYNDPASGYAGGQVWPRDGPYGAMVAHAMDAVRDGELRMRQMDEGERVELFRSEFGCCRGWRYDAVFDRVIEKARKVAPRYPRNR